MDFPLYLQSLLNGEIGAIIYILIMKYGWMQRSEILRRLIIGMLAGYITHLLGHFDPLSTILAGYVGLDFIESIIDRTESGKKNKVDTTGK